MTIVRTLGCRSLLPVTGNIEAQSGFVSLQFPPIGDCGGHQSSVKPQRYDWDRPFNERTALRRVPPRRGPFLPSS